MNFTIKHDDKSRKFFTTISGKECSLKYEKINDQLLDFKLMYVPANLRGQGLAEIITEFAIDFARKNGIKIKSSCSFVSEYLSTHKDAAVLLYS
jgi:predicted GNAT family acetyltransferase